MPRSHTASIPVHGTEGREFDADESYHVTSFDVMYICDVRYYNLSLGVCRVQ